MSLDAETIRRLTEKKRAPREPKASTGGGIIARRNAAKRMIRLDTQYPKLVDNPYVKRYEGFGNTVSKPCTSFNCRAPSYHLFKGEPVCNVHLIYALVYELNSVTSSSESERASGESTPTLGTDSPLAFAAVTVSTNESEEDDTDDEYL